MLSELVVGRDVEEERGVGGGGGKGKGKGMAPVELSELLIWLLLLPESEAASL